MKYGELVELTGGLECFDLPTVVQGFPGRRDSIRAQLARWLKEGKLIGLRRGFYSLPEPYRRVPLSLPLVANQLYRPSYLSGPWALGYYDLIPERVVSLTSVTPRQPRRFENPLGVFEYRHLKPEAFFGYGSVPYAGREIIAAEPEKALLDHWHLTTGEWTVERLAEMRYQNRGLVEPERLREYAARFGRPRLVRAADRWLELAAEAESGTVEL